MDVKTTTTIKRLPSQSKNADDKQTEIRGDFNKKSKKGADKLRKTRQNSDMNYLLDIPEVCELLRVGRSTLYGLVNGRQLVAVKLAGRTLFRRSDLAEFLNSLPEYEGELYGF